MISVANIDVYMLDMWNCIVASDLIGVDRSEHFDGSDTE